jgi:hypothetical protein
LGRLFDLATVPSNDVRFPNAFEDIWQHTENNPEDWADDWIFSDNRFSILTGDDDYLLRFICEMVHPVVRLNTNEVDSLVSMFNEQLMTDGWMISPGKRISGRPVYIAQRIGSTSVLQVEMGEMWEPNEFRLFLSHTSQHKVQLAQLKNDLSDRGISAFVAHEDIEPTQDWQSVIKLALKTMHGLTALLTPDFKESKWTDQEVGFAICRDVLVIPVKLGLDPYGFIGGIQALTGSLDRTDAIAEGILDILMKTPTAVALTREGLVTAFERAYSYANAKLLVARIMSTSAFNQEQLRRIEVAIENNSQIRDLYRGIPDKLRMFVRGERTRVGSETRRK